MATELNGSPSGKGFTDPVRNPALSPRLEPPLGIKPRSARYQRAALSLSYGGEWRKVKASNLCDFRRTTD